MDIHPVVIRYVELNGYPLCTYSFFDRECHYERSTIPSVITGHMLMRRYCLSTVKSYRYWIKLFIIVDGKSPLTEVAVTSMELVLVISPVSAERHNTLVV